VSHMLKAIHAQESRDAADRKARAIVDDLYQVPESVTLQRFPNQVESDSTWRTMGGSPWGLRYRCEKISMRVGYAV
jgi:hypothetical protein